MYPVPTTYTAACSNWPITGTVACLKVSATLAEQAGRPVGEPVAGRPPRRAVPDAMSPAERRICALCGRAFALVMPPGEEETERDKLCPMCLALPAPPEEPQ